jgi:glutaredoxin
LNRFFRGPGAVCTRRVRFPGSHFALAKCLAAAFHARGIDTIVCISVNDAFVMNEWANDEDARGISFLPDGNGDFTRAMGMLVDKKQLGSGQRSWRYSMLVDNGIIKKMFIEPAVDGDPYEISDADTMLRHINPNGKLPSDVLLFTKPGCSFCAKAKKLLDSRGWAYGEVRASPRCLRAVSGKATTPQIFIDGKYVGDSADLERYFARM